MSTGASGTLVCPAGGEEHPAWARYCHDHQVYLDRGEETQPSRPDLPEPSEAEIQDAVKNLLAVRGLDVVDTSQDQPAQITRGLSDLIVFGDGRLIFAEIKARDGKQSVYQRRFEGWCRRAGVEYQIWRSPEDARAWIEGRERAA